MPRARKRKGGEPRKRVALPKPATWIRTYSILDSLTIEEIDALLNIAVGRSVPESSRVRVLEDNHLIFSDTAPQLSAEGHRVVAIISKEILGCDTGGAEYDQVIGEAVNCAEKIFGKKVILERQSFWHLRQSGLRKDFIGAAFKTGNGRTGAFRACGKGKFDVSLYLEHA